MHANGWRCPAGALERIEDPASPVIFARVLVPRNFSMDLNHRVQNVLDMLFFRQRSKSKTKIRACVARQHDTWARGVEIVARVADFPNAWNVGRCGTAAKDRHLKVLPETCLELERDLRLMRTGRFQRSYGATSYLADCGIWHSANRVRESWIKYCSQSARHTIITG